ncbi:Mur ligase family protein [Streptomyces albidoflavus]
MLPGSVVATPQSCNNEIGLPLTVTMADTATDHLVPEMGARHIGDIRDLTLVAPTDISIVTNVGTAHIGEFGDRDTIAEAKGEIVEAPAPGRLAVLNADDDYVQPMRERAGGSVVTFGLGEDADIRATELGTDAHGRASFTLVTPEGSAPVRLQFVGGVQVHNSLAAAAAGREPASPPRRSPPASPKHYRARAGGWRPSPAPTASPSSTTPTTPTPPPCGTPWRRWPRWPAESSSGPWRCSGG